MMGNFMEKLQLMQAQMEETKRKLDNILLEGFSPQEKVKATVNGNRKVISVEIKPDLTVLEKEELEDHITLALQNALDKAEKVNEKEMKGAAGSLLPGMGL